MAGVEAEAEAEAAKLHRLHGEPCANPACQQPLQTGKIRGTICTRDKCKQWLERSGLKRHKKSKKRPRDENARPRENGQHPQQAWADGARSRASEQPPKPTLTRVFALRGIACGEPRKVNGKTEITRTYKVEGLFRAARSKHSDAVDVQWVEEDEILDLLDPDEQCAEDELYAQMRELWSCGPLFPVGSRFEDGQRAMKIAERAS